MREVQYSLSDLLRVMQRLRDPKDGCPWDLAQDFASIVPSTLEECYELAAAIEEGDFEHVAEELGDVLFQVIFYSQLGAEQQLFSFDSVVSTLVEKLVRRHPHVFANGQIEGKVEDSTSVEEVGERWEQIKASERALKSHTGQLADVPLALPALPRAQKLQRRAAQVGFDWEESVEVFAKLDEEIQELRGALDSGRSDQIREEMGDILFTCVNLARHLGEDAETCLRDASRKFEDRFGRMERQAGENEQALSSMTPAQLEALWVAAKVSQNPVQD